MTHLEDLWDRLHVRPAPTAHILREGRMGQSAFSRNAVRRPLTAIVSVGALGLAFLAGTQVGGPSTVSAGGHGNGAGNGSHGLDGSDLAPVSFVTGLHSAKDCDTLLDSYRERALPLVSAWGWNGWGGGRVYAMDSIASAEKAPLASSVAGSATGSAADSGVTASGTGTNVQEAGVDEPDSVKTDGSVLVRVRGRYLEVWDVTGSEPVKSAHLTVPHLTNPQLLLTGTTVVVIGTDTTANNDGDQGTRVATVSIADPATPVVTKSLLFSNLLVDARQYDDVVRLVLTNGQPRLDFVQPGGRVGERTALQRNRELVQKSTIDDWLPTVDDGSGPRRLVECNAVALPDDVDEVGFGTVTVAGFDSAKPNTISAVAIAAPTSLTYSNTDTMYLADSGFGGVCAMCDYKIAPSSGGGVTHLYAFSLDGIDAQHVGSGTVDGFLKDRWSMDGVDDTLRLALGASSETRNASSVVTLKLDGTDLAEIGKLSGIAPEEQIMSVRWFDNLALLVTFRQTDPLFAVDLSDPTKPKILSELKALGYSAYLHPIGGDKILGIGVSDSQTRAKVSLFDISDLANVRTVGTARFEEHTQAPVSYEPKVFTWLPDRSMALTAIQSDDGQEYVGLIRVTADGVSVSQTKIGEGYGADRLRTIELPDHKVVLITEKDVAFFTP